MMTREQALYAALNYAKRYVLEGRSHVAKIWLRRALKFGPLSPMQVFNLKRYFEDRLLEEMGLTCNPRCHGSEQMLVGLEKRMGKP